eukprot:5697901-Pleurochrysis_carterae.AAC.2
MNENNAEEQLLQSDFKGNKTSLWDEFRTSTDLLTALCWLIFQALAHICLNTTMPISPVAGRPYHEMRREERQRRGQ